MTIPVLVWERVRMLSIQGWSLPTVVLTVFSHSTVLLSCFLSYPSLECFVLFLYCVYEPLIYSSSLLFFLIYLFCFWLHWVFVAVCGLFSSWGEQGLLLVAVSGLLIVVASRCRARAPGTWAQELWLAGSRVQAQQLWHTGPVAPRHVGSSWTRAWTHVPDRKSVV